MTDALADADYATDAVWAAACDHAKSPAEYAFRDVLRFHRDILNGGLAQALWNRRADCDTYIAAYEIVGLKPIAAFIAFVRRAFPARDEPYAEFLAADELDALTSVYVAASYNLPYACNGNRDDADFPLGGDWVERMALRYARANRPQFSSIIAAAEA